MWGCIRTYGGDCSLSEGSSDVYDETLSDVAEDREGKEEDVESQDEKEDELLKKMKKEQCSSDEDPIRRVLKVRRVHVELYMYIHVWMSCVMC